MAAIKTLLQRGLVFAAIGFVAEVISAAIPFWWLTKRTSNTTEITTNIGVFQICEKNVDCVRLAENAWIAGTQACVISGTVFSCCCIVLALVHLLVLRSKKYVLFSATVTIFLSVASNIASITTMAVIMVSEKPYGDGLPHAGFFLTCISVVVSFIGGLHFQKALRIEFLICSPPSGFSNPTHTSIQVKEPISGKTVPQKKLNPPNVIHRNELHIVPGSVKTTLSPNAYRDLIFDSKGEKSNTEARNGYAHEMIDSTGNRSSVNVTSTSDTSICYGKYQITTENVGFDEAAASSNIKIIVMDTSGPVTEANQDTQMGSNADSKVITSDVNLRRNNVGASAERNSTVMPHDSHNATMTSNRNMFPLLDQVQVQSECEPGSDGGIRVDTSDSYATRNSAIIVPGSVRTTANLSVYRSLSEVHPDNENHSPTVFRNSDVQFRKHTADSSVNRNSVTIVPGSVRSTLDRNKYPSLSQLPTGDSWDSSSNKPPVSPSSMSPADSTMPARFSYAPPDVMDFSAILRRKVQEFQAERAVRRSMLVTPASPTPTMTSNRNTYPFLIDQLSSENENFSKNNEDS